MWRLRSKFPPSYIQQPCINLNNIDMLLRQCASSRHRTRRLIGIGTGGNRFIELLAATHELRKLEQKDWDVAAGISAGALVAGLISQIPKGDYDTFDHDFTRARKKFLEDHSASPFQPRYPLGQYFNAVLCMLFGRPSLFRGMSEFVDKEFDQERFKKANRQLLVGVYDNETQSYRTVSSEKETTGVVRQAIIASCSIPVAMPEASVDGIGRCRDGGLVHTIPVQECLHFISENTRQGIQSHIDLLISDAIQTPRASNPGKSTVTSSLLDVTVSIVWKNLERDLVQLSEVLGDTRQEQQTALHLLRCGDKRNFTRPWGTIRIIAPISLKPKRKTRVSFRVPDTEQSKELVKQGIAAARASM